MHLNELMILSKKILLEEGCSIIFMILYPCSTMSFHSTFHLNLQFHTQNLDTERVFFRKPVVLHYYSLISFLLDFLL